MKFKKIDQPILEKIKQKKEFSQLPDKDVELAYSHFKKREVGDAEKVKLTRELLHKVFAAFGSKKLLSPKEKDFEWILKKHLSTRERYPFYKKIYQRILSSFGKRLSIIDLGAGVNGFSFSYFKKLSLNADYLGIESVGQLVNLTNDYFKKQKLNGHIVHMSLFKIKKLESLIPKMKRPRVIFLFKVIDSLEMLKKDFSKQLLSKISPLSDLIVVSFATETLIRRKKFYAKRKWLIDFLEKNFKIIDDFNFGGERYIVLKK